VAGSATGACGAHQRGPHLRRRLAGAGPASTPAGSAARCAGAMPAAGINGFAFPFSGWENLSRAEGIQRVRLSETPGDSDARASRLTPYMTPAWCSLLTRAFPVLRQADGHCEHRPGTVGYSCGRNYTQTISSVAESDLLRAVTR